ncbi:FBD-associated F-box protein At4g10400-like [Silene latifolia]|uniref:FBD-associated F-box protein At4g10400-like n=1 Tax=Silene latifolia TaxID=37657 RepID=UPI003D76C3B5
MATPQHQLDKISQLPDDILLKVLSTLDLKNAVKTSVLAKRWKYLWTWLTVLDFDTEVLFPYSWGWSLSDNSEPQRYINWVNQVVYGHRGLYLSKFRVFFCSSWGSEVSQVEKWARFAFSKRVEDLDLDLNLLGSRDTSRFSLGLDILKHPQNNGIVNLKSLRLSWVEISEEVLEFILLHCHLLEQLCVNSSETLHRLNIVSDKLKHLTLINCVNLKQLQIDAVNLISFHFKDTRKCVLTHMVFKRVPKLVEADFDGKSCMYPFPILERISHLPKQLTKLSLFPSINLFQYCELYGQFCPPSELFPNVKQLILTLGYLKPSLVFIKFFIHACPMLRELKIQPTLEPSSLDDEANLLQEIELEDGKNAEITIYKNSYPEAQKKNVVDLLERNDKNYKRHRNLRVLEVVGFRGCDVDVRCALDIIACASSFETLILNPRDIVEIEACRQVKDVEKISTIKRRARKLVKLLPPNVHVGVVDMPDVFWVS